MPNDHFAMFQPRFISLQRDLARKLGRPILQKSDALALEAAIFKFTGKLVSYNTIRRFFGLATGGEPRESILDIYAEYLGYPNYESYNISQERHTFYTDWQFTATKSSWTQAERDDLVTRAIQEDRVAQSMILFIFQRLYATEPFEAWIPWLKSPGWHENADSFGLRMFYTNTFADLIRKRVRNETEARELLQHDVIVEWVVHFFVDYSTLMDGYFRHTSKVLYKRDGASIFTSGIQSVYYIWNNQWERAIPFLQEVLSVGYDPDSYPVLNSRYFASRVYLEKYQDGTLSSTSLVQIQGAFSQEQSKMHFLLALELFPTMALCGFAQEILDLAQFNTGFNTEVIHWSASLDLDLMRLALMNAHALLGNYQAFSELEQQVSPSKWYASYKRYQEALYSLAERRIGRSELRFADSLAYYPGIAALT